MSFIKRPRIGVYGDKTRALQKRLSYERVSLTWKTVNVYKYLGVKGSANLDPKEIEDKIFFETRNRDYDPEPAELNAHFEPMQEEQTDLSRFGIISPLSENLRIYMHTGSFESLGLNRYIRNGDIIEIPFWEQRIDGKVIKSFWEVVEIDRKKEFETFTVVVTVEPVRDRQETQDLDGLISNSDVMDEIYTDVVDEMDTFIDEKSNTGDVTNIVDDCDESRLYNPTPNFIEDFITDNKIVIPRSWENLSQFGDITSYNYNSYLTTAGITSETVFGDISVVG